MTKFLSLSEKETKYFAYSLAKKFSKGVIALTGDLGAGKTSFAKGFASGLGIKDKIISPTFVLIKQHKIPKKNNIFYHIDLYRLEDASLIKELGLEEIINNPENLILIEWADKLKKLPKKALRISIKKTGENTRMLVIKS